MTLTQDIQPSSLQKELLTILGYFDYFQYPLSKEQLVWFSKEKIESTELFNAALDSLLQLQSVEQKDGYYALNSIDTYLEKRLEGELRFEKMQARISKTASRISKFPFVKFVGLSGSLSKGYAPHDADIDLFIITAKNRLWICRTFLHLMKKLSFLKRSQHYYCMNYFVDETAMEIEEQNFFTAIELSTLRPLVDESDYYAKLMEHNQKWVQQQLPNFQVLNRTPKIKTDLSFWGKIASAFSSDGLNELLMKLTDMKWRKKWKKKNYAAEDYELAFKTRINISKNHLHNYQKKLLQHLDSLKA